MTEPLLRIDGRVLYLTSDSELLRRQLAGESLPYDPDRELIDDVSTDEIAPSWACYYSDATLGRFALTGLRGGLIGRDDVRDGGFAVIVSGKSKGCGSSRETAPYAELAAGIRLVIAKSFEKIYLQNCENIGLFTSTDFSLLERIERGEPIRLAELARGLDPLSAAIVRAGGLFQYNQQRRPPTTEGTEPAGGARPMTVAEKIILSHAAPSSARKREAVAPGKALFVRADVRFSHDYVTKMADALFRHGFGDDAEIADPASLFLFRDHLTLLERVMTPEHRRMGLAEQARSLKIEQRAFARRHGLKLYGELDPNDESKGSEAICHNKVIEELALPGQVVVGTDSHTCMAGVLGCLAFGIGSTDMANAWWTGDVRLRVPETVRIELTGKLSREVTAKDVMLHLLRSAFVRDGGGIGKVLEFCGDGVSALDLDERATLTNMAVEAGGFTGIIEPDELVIDYLCRMRNLPREGLERAVVRSDPGAHYAATLRVDLGQIEPMVALPGDPKNGVPLRSLLDSSGPIPIDIAYAGSCTGGKKSDMDAYARILTAAVSAGRRVPDGVSFYVQFGSRHIREYAEERGYVEVFSRFGAELLGPSCGACIRAGPGTSTRAEQVTVSAVNRNYPGRSGPGRVYLASPLVVAASAVAGKLALPEASAPQPTRRT